MFCFIQLSQRIKTELMEPSKSSEEEPDEGMKEQKSQIRDARNFVKSSNSEDSVSTKRIVCQVP